MKTQARPDWRAVAVYYMLACLWSWPLFWWRDKHEANWNAVHLPPEFKAALIMWGPGVAALAVFALFPQTRSRALTLAGSSWRASLCFFLTPIVFAMAASAVLAKPFSFKLAYYLVVGGLSALGEETGWRGFLQGALRPMGRIRGYLVVSLLWAGWHFTSQTGGTWQGLVSRLEILIPTVVVVTFLLAWLTEHTGSLLLAAAFHEWLDIGVDSGGYFLWAALASIPVWIWLVLKWPTAKARSPSREPALSA